MRRWASRSCAARAAPVRRISPAREGNAGERATDLCEPSWSVTSTWNSPLAPAARWPIVHRSASGASARPTLVAAWRPRGGGPSSGRPSRAGRDIRRGGSCDDALEWCRWSASTSCSLFIDDRPWMPACLASAYSCLFDLEASTPFPLAGPSRTHQAPTCGSLSAPFRRRARKCGSLTHSPAALPRGEISPNRRLFSPHAHRVTYRANGSLGASLRGAQRSSVSKLFRA